MKKIYVSKKKKHKHIVGREYDTVFFGNELRDVYLYIGHELGDVVEDEQQEVDDIYNLKNGSYNLDLLDFYLNVSIVDCK